jgi:serine/threonine-protein kinase PpkA
VALIQIAGYNVLGQIGRGGMATVYRARQTLLDREVALKVMSQQLAQDPVYAQRFLQEARMLAALNHPHVVPVYDVGVTPDGLHYFSMQLLSGGDFAGRMREGLSEVELVRVLIAVAHALGFAHARGYVHRDVTPANILFDAHDTPILTDFGIARAVTSASRITASGLSIGTSHYMSPEQARGAEVDHRSDIYSLGVLCFEAVAGHPPFEGEDGFAVAFAHVHDPVPRLPDEGARWQPLIDRAMAKDPAYRYADCAAFIEGLRAIAPEEFNALGAAAEGPAKRVPAAPPAPARKPMRLPPRPPWPVFALGAVAGVLIGLAIWFALRPPSDEVAGADLLAGPDSAAAPSVPAAAAPGDPASPEATTGDDTTAPGDAPGQPPADDAAPGDVAAASVVAPGEPHTVVDPVAALVSMGRANIAALRLTSPPVTNALERFKLALSIEPGNVEAAQGIADVAQAYLDLAAQRDPGVDPQAWLDALALAEKVAAEHPRAAPKAEAARAERLRYAASERERGETALARWDKETAGTALANALRAMPDDQALRRALAQVDRVGAVGYRFRDGEDASLPEMVVVDATLALGRTEVTVAQFRRYWRAAGQARFGTSLPTCRDRESVSPFRSTRGRSWESPNIAQGDDHPVVCLSFAMAEGYAAWLAAETGQRYRLPRAAELARFAGAPDSPCEANLRDAAYRAEYGGREGPECNDGHAATAPVGTFPRRPPGLRDTHGNVREWTADCPASHCRERIAVGLGWHSPPGASLQESFNAETGFNTIGLRVARDID